MGRLVIAVVILFAVLAGLRFANASLFQRNVANQINSSASDTRSTGFSAESTDAASSAGVSQSTSPLGTQPGGDTTALPPRQQPAVPADW